MDTLKLDTRVKVVTLSLLLLAPWYCAMAQNNTATPLADNDTNIQILPFGKTQLPVELTGLHRMDQGHDDGHGGGGGTIIPALIIVLGNIPSSTQKAGQPPKQEKKPLRTELLKQHLATRSNPLEPVRQDLVTQTALGIVFCQTDSP